MFQEPGARPWVSPARSAARQPQPPPHTHLLRSRRLPGAAPAHHSRQPRARPTRCQNARYWAQQRRAERHTYSRGLVGCVCRRSELSAPPPQLRQDWNCAKAGVVPASGPFMLPQQRQPAWYVWEIEIAPELRNTQAPEPPSLGCCSGLNL